MKKFYEFRQCNHCGGHVTEIFCGDDGVSVCGDCNAVEGGDKTAYADESGNIYTEEEVERMERFSILC